MFNARNKVLTRQSIIIIIIIINIVTNKYRFTPLALDVITLLQFGMQYIYSKTSINDHSEKRPTSLERPNHAPPIATTTKVHLEPPRSNHLLFPTSDQFLSPILLKIKITIFAPL